MSAPDPNAPTIQVGETAANFSYRVQDYMYRIGSGVGSANAAMAAQWVALLVTGPMINGFVVA